MSRPFYPQGRYKCEVVNQGIGESSATKTPQVTIRFRVLETEAGEPVTQYERTVYLYLTEKAIERSVACLRALGYTRDSFKFIDKTQGNYHDMTGETFIGFCAHEEYQGDDREKWGIAIESEFTPPAAEPKKLRELDNLFGRYLKSNAPTQRTQREPVPAGGMNDDDVPF